MTDNEPIGRPEWQTDASRLIRAQRAHIARLRLILVSTVTAAFVAGALAMWCALRLSW